MTLTSHNNIANTFLYLSSTSIKYHSSSTTDRNTNTSTLLAKKGQSHILETQQASEHRKICSQGTCHEARTFINRKASPCIQFSAVATDWKALPSKLLYLISTIPKYYISSGIVPPFQRDHQSPTKPKSGWLIKDT